MKILSLTAAVALTVAMTPGAVSAHGGPAQPQPVTNIPPIDGSNHNLSDPTANQAGAALKRFLPDAYLDHLGGDPSQFPGQDRPGERDISNHVFAQDANPVLNPLNNNNFLWQFGQFLDHDFGITVEKFPGEPIDIVVPADDPFFDPILRPYITIERQDHDPGTGIAPAPNPRLSLNVQSGWIDASQVYGYGQDLPGPGPFGPTPGVLREFSGGRLLVEPGTNLLPRIPTVLPTPQFPSTLFVCGDFFPRCNETPGLTMIHTLFVREHNRKVAEYAASNPALTDEELFQLGRRWVTSLMQSITVNEFVPTLTGRKVSRYRGHKPSVNGRLGLEFEHSLYRLGHTLLTRNLQRHDGQHALPPLDLGESLFQAPALFQTSADLDAVVRGFIRQTHEKVDCIVADGVRNTLIVDEPGTPGTLFDLPAINLARGRERRPAELQRDPPGLRPAAGVALVAGLRRQGVGTPAVDLLGSGPGRSVRRRHLREGGSSGAGPHRSADHRGRPPADRRSPRRRPVLVREHPDSGSDQGGRALYAGGPDPQQHRVDPARSRPRRLPGEARPLSA